MTRKEEIKLAASCHIAASNEDFKEYYEGFIAGAEWADETMIDKACEWLENELYEVMAEPNHYYIYDVQSKSYNSLEVLINNFKKAMES